jgi:hypothetical protein
MKKSKNIKKMILYEKIKYNKKNFFYLGPQCTGPEGVGEGSRLKKVGEKIHFYFFFIKIWEKFIFIFHFFSKNDFFSSSKIIIRRKKFPVKGPSVSFLSSSGSVKIWSRISE